MKVSTSWVLWILIALPCSALNEDFMIGVSTDRRVYQLGETVEITGTVTNGAVEEQYLKYDGNPCSSYSVWVEDSQGEIVARENRICTWEWNDGQHIEPFTSIPVTSNPWHQNIGDYGPNEPPPHSDHVGPGTYRVVLDYHLKDPAASRPFVICDGVCPEPRSLVIPAAGNNPGLHGTSWSTDLAFQGLGGGDTIVAVSMLEHGPAGARAQPVEIVVPDLGTLHFTNVLETLFGHQGQAALFLEIKGGDLHVSSRTINTSNTGTYAQAVPAVSAGTGRSAILVPGLRHGDGIWRTNLGIINLHPWELDVDVVVNTGTGSAIPIGPITLGPYEYRQINGIFRDLVDPQQELLTASVWIVDSRHYLHSRFLAYGSVIDNRTGDAIFVQGEPARHEENLY